MANKDFFDGKWHVAIPFEEKGDKDKVGMIDMAGFDKTELKRVRIGHWRTLALMVAVDSEEVYREIMRPIQTEQRKKVRERRCLIPDGKGSMVRCPIERNCGSCCYKYTGYTCPESLDQLMNDKEFDVPDDENNDPALIFEQQSFITELWDYVATLGDEDRIIANAILTQRPDKEVMRELGISKQSTYSSRKIRVKKLLQKRFSDWQ